MRNPSYNTKAAKQTVSVTINSDLYRQAKALGLNASQIAEEALAGEVERRKTEQLKAEIQQDIAACNAYVEKHGSFTDMVREHYGHRSDDDE
jgi:antitoxin CcdA